MAKKPATQEELNKVYQEVLGRDADKSGIASYSGKTAAQIKKALLGSEEFSRSGQTKKDVEQRTQALKVQTDLQKYSKISSTKGVEKGSFFTLAEGAKADDRSYEAGELPDGTKLYVKGDKQTSGLAGKLGVDKIVGKDVYKIAGKVGAGLPGAYVFGDEMVAIAGGTKGAAQYQEGRESVLGKKGAEYTDQAGDIAGKVIAGVLAPASFGGSLVAEQALDVSARSSLNQKVNFGDEAVQLGMNLLSANIGRIPGIAAGSNTQAALAGGVQAVGGLALGSDLEDVLLNSSLAALSAKMSGPAKEVPGKAPPGSPALKAPPGSPALKAPPGDKGLQALELAAPGPAAPIKPGEIMPPPAPAEPLGPMKVPDEAVKLKPGSYYLQQPDGSTVFVGAQDVAKGIKVPEGAALKMALGDESSQALVDAADLSSGGAGPDSIGNVLDRMGKRDMDVLKITSGISIATMLGTAGIQYMGIQKQDDLARDQLKQEKEIFYAGLDAESGYMNAAYAASASGGGSGGGSNSGGAPAAIW